MAHEHDFLIHYGIKGQQWGIRRYQNEDRTRTEEGKVRYRRISKDFRDAEKKVKENIDSKVRPVKVKKTNLEKVKARGRLSDIEAKKCIGIADKVFNRAMELEPKITEDVIQSVISSGSEIFGLENRIKQPESIAAKIGSDAKEKGLSFEKAAQTMNDVLRYTSITDEENFVKSYNATRTKLEALGYNEIKCKNYFDLYDQGKVKHKSVTSVYSDKKGNIFELQYHTPLSQAAKELKTPVYEERRQTDLTRRRIYELESKMTRLAEQVRNPKNVKSIRSH